MSMNTSVIRTNTVRRPVKILFTAYLNMVDLRRIESIFLASKIYNRYRK